MSSFTPIELNKLPAPDLLELLDFEKIVTERIARLRLIAPDFDALVESDPAFKLEEAEAYREGLIIQLINQKAKSVMLAFAAGTDLDHLAALFNLQRQITDAGDPDAVPPVPPTYETDDRLRYRIQLAPESFSTAGSISSYTFHALNSDARIQDIDVSSPAPGHVQVTVLSSIGDGTPDPDMMTAVTNAITAEDVRPLTDQVTVIQPTIINYSVDATLTLYPGPDASLVMAAASEATQAYVDTHHRLGHDIKLSGLYAALHQPGVQDVVLNAPLVALEINDNQAAYCTDITINSGGVDE